MTRITAEALYALLPAIHRLRDAREGEPLRALVAVLAREGAVVEEAIEQAMDDLFIETCAPWAVPYVGGVVGYRALYPVEGLTAGSRAEVANTIAYRRRKGTAAVLEQLARDVTGWPASAVEYFMRTATCQHMNVAKPEARTTADLHSPLDLERLGGAFDRVARSVDVRSIAQGRGRMGIGGRHNLPNVGIHLWRLMAKRVTNAPTTRVDDRRYLFDALGAPRQLVNRQEAEREITALAGPVNVPCAITRRMLDATPTAWVAGGDGGMRAFDILVDGVAVATADIVACDLSDDGGGWAHSPHGEVVVGTNRPVRVDPELGRLAFPEPETGEVRVSFHTAFPAPIGGGEYNRARSLPPPDGAGTLLRFPNPLHATIQDALDALPPEGGIVEIEANDVFDAPATIAAPTGTEVGLRAADGFRPLLRGATPIAVSGGADARVALNGITLEGCALHVVADPGGSSLAALELAHMTLIPGRSFTATGAPATPGAESLRVEATGVEVAIARSITGPLRMTDTTNLRLEDSIVDAAAADPADSAEALAIAGLSGEGDPAGALTILASTVIGRILARSLPLVSDAILFARPATAGEAPVRALRRQEGCLRFSFVPDGSITPRRFRCQPQLAIDEAVAAREAASGAPVTDAVRAKLAAHILPWLVPGFTALSASAPAYAQLRRGAPAEIRTGASDEGEMGAFHLLHEPQREANLRIRLDEYLRFGLEAGLIFET
jgi:hypothetical protein